MSEALQAVHSIKPATSDISVHATFVVFVRGPLRAHTDALDDLWARVQTGLLGGPFNAARLLNQARWAALPEGSATRTFTDLFGLREPLRACWGIELSAQDHRAGDEPYIMLELRDLAPVRGMERASHLRVLFAENTPADTMASLGKWAINHLALWWGSAGFVFHHHSGSMFTAHKQMAALAKRYWGVQIQDMTSLQWDALNGMPGVNWLTLVGEEFARSKDIAIDRLSADAATMVAKGVFRRTGPNGVAIAAGREPLRGDINTGEDLGADICVARLIQPLLLSQHTPLFGPFAKPEVLGSWLERFVAPQKWLDCDITPE